MLINGKKILTMQHGDRTGLVQHCAVKKHKYIHLGVNSLQCFIVKRSGIRLIHAHVLTLFLSRAVLDQQWRKQDLLLHVGIILRIHTGVIGLVS